MANKLLLSLQLRHGACVACAFYILSLGTAALAAEQKTAPAPSGPYAPLDYPCWRGPLGSGAAGECGAKLIEKAADAKLAWESEAQDLPHSSLTGGGQATEGISGGFGGPVVADGRVYLAYYVPGGETVDEEALKGAVDKRREKWFVAADDVVVCLDAATGKTLWKRVLKGKGLNQNYRLQGPFMQPCIAVGRLFLLGTGARLFCLDAKTGEPVWEQPLGAVTAALDKIREGPHAFRGLEAQGLNSSPAYADGVVVCNDHSGLITKTWISSNDGLVAFDAESGQPRWTLAKAASATASPLTWNHQGKSYIVVGGLSRALCVEPRTGRVVWETPGLLNVKGTVAVNEEYLVCTGAGEQENAEGVGATCFRIDLQGARQVWRLEPEKKTAWASPLIYAGRVYVGGKCVDLATGKVLERFPLDITSPVAAGGRIVVGNKLYDAETLSDLGRFGVPYEPNTAVALADGRLFIRGTKDAGGDRLPLGRIYCLDLKENTR
jgi:outer membrane protein assembly factor BamB